VGAELSKTFQAMMMPCAALPHARTFHRKNVLLVCAWSGTQVDALPAVQCPSMLRCM
jgi:hypothetical protein